MFVLFGFAFSRVLQMSIVQSLTQFNENDLCLLPRK